MEVPVVLIDYLASIKHLGKGSQVDYQQKLTVFASWCTEHQVTLEKVNNRHVQTFLEYIKTCHTPHKAGKTELSTQTLAGYVRVIWTLLYWCMEDEEYCQYVRLQTIKGIKLPRIEAFIKETFTDAEIKALFAACLHGSKTHEYRLRDTALVSVLLDTGIRAEELRTLTIEHVSLAKGVNEDSYITVMGKGRKEREIPLGNASRRAISRYIREWRTDAKKTDTVFVSRDGRGQLSHPALRDILLRLKKLSTLPEDAQVNPHKYRHSFAARFMANGGDIYDLSRLMGHSSIAITESYLKSLSAKQVRQRKKHLSVLDEL